MEQALLNLSPMNNPIRSRLSTRVQTTISVLEEAVEGLDGLAQASGVSRSRLMDLAVRRFLRWAANLDPQDLQLIAEYEVTEPISGFVRRTTPPPMSAVVTPQELPRAKVLSSSSPPATVPPAPQSEPGGPVTPRRARRIPVEETPRVRDRQGRYTEGR